MVGSATRAPRGATDAVRGLGLGALNRSNDLSVAL